MAAIPATVPPEKRDTYGGRQHEEHERLYTQPDDAEQATLGNEGNRQERTGKQTESQADKECPIAATDARPPARRTMQPFLM